MPQASSTRDIVLSFADMIATATLPPPASSLVTTVLPKIADFVFPQDSLAAYAANDDSSITQTVTLQDGTRFTITVSQETTPELHKALLRAHEDIKSADSQATQKNQVFVPYTNLAVTNQSKGAVQNSGGISILNGIIGISW